MEALLAVDLLGGLLDNLLTLGKDHLDVAGVGHVGVDLDWLLESGDGFLERRY